MGKQVRRERRLLRQWSVWRLERLLLVLLHQPQRPRVRKLRAPRLQLLEGIHWERHQGMEETVYLRYFVLGWLWRLGSRDGRGLIQLFIISRSREDTYFVCILLQWTFVGLFYFASESSCNDDLQRPTNKTCSFGCIRVSPSSANPDCDCMCLVPAEADKCRPFHL